MKGGLLALGLASLVLAAAVGLLSTPGNRRDPAKIQIGAPDDTGGLIIHYILNGKGFPAAEVTHGTESYSLKDCCASASEWALSTDRLDMAVMCPDAARCLVEKDPRFEIAGPVLLNSDVMVIRPGTHLAKIGIAHKRGHQEEIVREKFPGGCDTVPMLPAGLPFAFERGVVDGVVIDVLKAFSLAGERIASRSDGRDFVAYVLVARKELASSPLYQDFMNACQRAVEELAHAATLARAIEAYKEIPWTDRETQEWKALRVRFVLPRKTGT